MKKIKNLNGARVWHEIRSTVSLALPLILTQIAAVGANVIDTLLAGRHSAHVLGAVAVGTSIWSLVIVTGLGMMMALPPTVAQLDGAGRRTEIGAVFQQAIWLALFLGLGLGVLVRHADPLIQLIGVAPSLRQSVDEFLDAVSWGAPALTLYFGLRGLSEGLSRTRPPMYFGFGGLLILIPLGYVFMFGKLGIPPQGARGCGIATALVLWLEVLGFALYVACRKYYRGLGLGQSMAWPSLLKMRPLIKMGLPMTVTLLAEAGLFIAAALLIGTLGETVIAAHQVALNVATLAFMLPLGLSMAITVRVGHAVGRQDAAGVRFAGLSGIAMTLVTQLVSASLMLFLAHRLASLYTRDEAVRTLAAQFLMLAGLFQFSDGIQAAANGALRGLKDTRVPMTITLFAYWIVGMPLGWWLTFNQGMGARGMWIGMIAGLSMAAVLLFARFWHSAFSETWRITRTDSLAVRHG